MMDISINGEKDLSESMNEAQSQAPSSDRPMFWTICAFCCARYKSYRSLLNKPTQCQSFYLEFFASKSLVATGKKENQTMEKSVSSQSHVTKSNSVASTPKNQVQPQKAQPQRVPRFLTRCPFCELKLRCPMKCINKLIICKCDKKFKAVPGTHLPGKESSPGLSCAVKVGDKRKRSECGEGYNAENRILVLNNRRRVSINNRDAREDSESGKQVHEVDPSTKDPMSDAMYSYQTMDNHRDAQVRAAFDKAVDNIRRGLNGNEDAVRREESGWGKQLHEVDLSYYQETFPNVINTKQKIGRDQDAQMGAVIDNNRHGFNDNEDA